MAVRLEDLGGMLGGHSGTEDQPVCLVQRSDRLGAEIVPLQTDHVDAADLRGVALDEHVRGHVVDDSRQAADVAIGADPDELVQSDGAGDGGERLDVNVAGEHGVVGHEDAVAEHAIVADDGRWPSGSCSSRPG